MAEVPSTASVPATDPPAQTGAAVEAAQVEPPSKSEPLGPFPGPALSAQVEQPTAAVALEEVAATTDAMISQPELALARAAAEATPLAQVKDEGGPIAASMSDLPPLASSSTVWWSASAHVAIVD